jgi:hypothetical protein
MVLPPKWMIMLITTSQRPCGEQRHLAAEDATERDFAKATVAALVTAMRGRHGHIADAQNPEVPRALQLVITRARARLVS